MDTVKRTLNKDNGTVVDTGGKTMLQKMCEMYEKGDIVSYVPNGNAKFYGIVVEVNPSIGKLMVSWAGQKPTQHCPDELMLLPDIMEGRKHIKIARKMKVADYDESANAPMIESVAVGMMETRTVGEQLKHVFDLEIVAASTYWRASLQLRTKGLEGLGKMLEEEGNGEIEHAMKVLNIMRLLGMVEQPEVDEEDSPSSDGVLSLFTGLELMEFNLLQEYKLLAELGKKESNSLVEKFAQDMVELQQGEYKDSKNLLQKIQGATSDGTEVGLYIVDSMMKTASSEDSPNFNKTASTKEGADIHGISKPRGGGFSIMEDLQKDLHEEAQKKSSRRESSSKTAMYWMDKGRVYRLTRDEQGNSPICPKCKAEMDRQPFTKSDKILVCKKCTFKIPTSSVVTTSPSMIEIEVPSQSV